MMEYTSARSVARMFAALGDPIRLKVATLLFTGPHNVGQLAKLVGVPMVNMSHHLGVMKQAGVLEDEKKGRTVVYRFRDEVFKPGTDGTVGTLTFGPFLLHVLAQPGVKAKKKSVAS